MAKKFNERKGRFLMNEKVIERNDYLNKIIARKGNGLIKVITGIRRCGKSYMLNNLFYNYLIEDGVKDDHIIKLALDIATPLL